MGRWLTAGTRTLLIFALMFAARGTMTAAAQGLRYARKPDAEHGKAIYMNGCNQCHGDKGNGAPATETVFKRPSSFPDFTRCDQTTPEPNSNWKDVILHGGPSRGFSPIMPAFGQLLKPDDADDVIAYLRSFCASAGWPRGELNLPRAIVTEKAFPEDELVISTAANSSGAPGWTTDFIHEQSFGKRDQIEVDVPWEMQRANGSYASHVGDITFGLKHVMYSNLHTGTIVSLQGGVLPPTGSKKMGGNETTVFEPFAAIDQLFPTNTWIQFQMGADLPRHPDMTPQSLYWYTALGQTLSPDHRLGRQWSPMVEFLANRDLQDGAKTDWDVMPEMQVTLSPRQHIRLDVGYRRPFTDTAGRTPQLDFYILWDWADGKFWEGW